MCPSISDICIVGRAEGIGSAINPPSNVSALGDTIGGRVEGSISPEGFSTGWVVARITEWAASIDNRKVRHGGYGTANGSASVIFEVDAAGI